MKWFVKGKDGGPESKVNGFWLFESKRFGSIALLKFDEGSREAFHTHAFDAISWVLMGELLEVMVEEGVSYQHKASLKPVITRRSTFHRVFGIGPQTWALTFRGPWVPRWKEWIPSQNKHITLTNGRKEVSDD